MLEANLEQQQQPYHKDLIPEQYLQRQIKSRYSVFKNSLQLLPQIVDKLVEQSILSPYDVEDIHACRHQREMIDCLLKKLLMEKGYDGCRVFTDVISTVELGSQGFILTTPSRLQLDERFDTNVIVAQMNLRNADILDYMPNFEKLIDLMVETDAFSIHEHDEVIKTKTRKKQLQVMIRQITNSDKVNVFLQALDALGCKSVVKYLLGFSDSPVSTTDEMPGEPTLEIDGSSLLMGIDETQNTHFDLMTRVNAKDQQSIERRITEEQNAEVDKLADKLAKLSIYNAGNGTDIIEFKAQSDDSLHCLRKEYLDGTLNGVIKQMLPHMGINNFADEGGSSIEVEIGTTADREKRKEANKSEHAELLKLNQAFLLEELDPLSILEAMKTKEVFTEQQIMWLLNKEPRSRKTRVKEILNLIRWMHTSTFEIFMTSLKEGKQRYIYKHLQRKCNPEVIRKRMKENKQKIIAMMDISMLRDLCRRCLFYQAIGMKKMADYKQQVLNHISKSSNEVILSFEDVIYAAGLDHLLQEHKDPDDVSRMLQNKYSDINPNVFPVQNLSENEENIIILALSDKIEKNWDSTFEGYEVYFKNPKYVNKEALVAVGAVEKKHKRIGPGEMNKLKSTIQVHGSQLFQNHKNLNIISVCPIRSRSNGEIIEQDTCIVLYCSCKGLKPYEEEKFPRYLDYKGEKIAVDVREGFFEFGPTYQTFASTEYHQKIKMGCSFSIQSRACGTVGPFVKCDGSKCFLTCAHVTNGIDPPTGYNYDTRQHPHSPLNAMQPSDGSLSASGLSADRRCGEVVKAVFKPLDFSSPRDASNIDAAVIRIIDRRVPDRGEFALHTMENLQSIGFTDLPRYEDGSAIINHTQLNLDSRVVKFGMTTHATRGCITFDGIWVRSCQACLQTGSGTSVVHMANQYEIGSISTYPVFFQTGDSGSGVYQVKTHRHGDVTEQRLELLGLGIGYTSYNAAVVTPIGPVLEALGLDVNDLKVFDS